MATSKSRLAAGALSASYDGNYWPRYPYGNLPFPFAANAGAVAQSTPALIANPNTSLLAFLNSLAASPTPKMLSGQHTDYFTGAAAQPWDDFTSGTTISSANIAGYLPSMFGLAVQGPYNAGAPTQQSIGGAAGIVSLANTSMAAGAVPLVTMWGGNPATNVFGPQANSGDLTACFSAVNGVLVTNSTIQNNWLANLAAIAVTLNGINGAYIFQPFPEANGTWNWWAYGGYTNGPTAAQFRALWTLTRNYLISKGVNCLWCYDVYVNTGAANTYTAGFVAGQTDVVAFDAYSDTPGSLAQIGNCYSTLLATGCPLIIGLLGNGTSSAPSGTSYETVLSNIKTQCPEVVAVNVWCQGWALAANSGAAAFMGDSAIIVRGSPPPLQPSADGTTIPNATQIVDASLNVWTVVGGIVFVQPPGGPSAAAGFSSGVSLLLWYGGVIYQSAAGKFYAWNATTSAWGPGQSDPRTSVSPDGTTIPPATQILDSAGHVWTVSGGVVFEDGASAGYSANVTELLWYGGVIYQGAGGVFYPWNQTTLTWGAAQGSPRASASGTTDPPASQIFDAADNIWTLQGGVVLENGTAV